MEKEIRILYQVYDKYMLWIYEPGQVIQRTRCNVLCGTHSACGTRHAITCHKTVNTTLEFVAVPFKEGSLFDRHGYERAS